MPLFDAHSHGGPMTVRLTGVVCVRILISLMGDPEIAREEWLIQRTSLRLKNLYSNQNQHKMNFLIIGEIVIFNILKNQKLDFVCISRTPLEVSHISIFPVINLERVSTPMPIKIQVL